MELDDAVKLKPSGVVSISDLEQLAEDARGGVERARERMLSPTTEKEAPVFTSGQVAEFCRINRAKLNYRIGKGDLPAGKLSQAGGTRNFTLAEARIWIAAYAKNIGLRRPVGARAATIAIGNFKGGVTKTSTTMGLAQGLTLRGHRVLVIDLDSQGSLTTLCGYRPQQDFGDKDTFLGLVTGEASSAKELVRNTYWDGLDILPAAPSLTGADLFLPNQQLRVKGYQFWNVLNAGLETVRDEYDVILIDTPPALSYVTMNAFYAADGLIIPLPPSPMDFFSAAQFWELFHDMAQMIRKAKNVEKEYDFVRILLAMVDTSVTGGVVRTWISETYKELVLPVEIPKSDVTKNSAAEFGSLYDIARYEGNRRTYQRLREAYDLLVKHVEGLLGGVWERQLQRGGVEHVQHPPKKAVIPA
jgi:chromosome partitioning protein